jgi:hypothetical protein
LLRVTFIHPKACFPLPLVSDLYALREGGLNLTLQQHIYMRPQRVVLRTTVQHLLYMLYMRSRKVVSPQALRVAN